jgi:adenylate cyclase
LGAYYLKDGKADPLVIDLPKGGYVPRVREVVTEDPIACEGPKRSQGPRSRVWIALTLAGVVVGLSVLGWWIQHRGAPTAIAVLPLDNTSHDPANEYFADGLTDELIRNLSIIDV